jgi:hypothetical protein
MPSLQRRGEVRFMRSSKASRFPLENHASLSSQLPSVDSAEVADLVSVGNDLTDLPALYGRSNWAFTAQQVVGAFRTPASPCERRMTAPPASAFIPELRTSQHTPSLRPTARKGRVGAGDARADDVQPIRSHLGGLGLLQSLRCRTTRGRCRHRTIERGIALL